MVDRWENDWRTPAERQEDYEIGERLARVEREEHAKKLREANQAEIIANRPWRQRKFSWAYDFETYGTYLNGKASALIVCSIVVFVFAVICPGAMTASYYSDRYDCRVLHETTGIETQWVSRAPWTWGCQVRVNGEWVPVEKWYSNSGR